MDASERLSQEETARRLLIRLALHSPANIRLSKDMRNLNTILANDPQAEIITPKTQPGHNGWVTFGHLADKIVFMKRRDPPVSLEDIYQFYFEKQIINNPEKKLYGLLANEPLIERAIFVYKAKRKKTLRRTAYRVRVYRLKPLKDLKKEERAMLLKFFLRGDWKAREAFFTSPYFYFAAPHEEHIKSETIPVAEAMLRTFQYRLLFGEYPEKTSPENGFDISTLLAELKGLQLNLRTDVAYYKQRGKERVNKDDKDYPLNELDILRKSAHYAHNRYLKRKPGVTYTQPVKASTGWAEAECIACSDFPYLDLSVGWSFFKNFNDGDDVK